MTFNNIEVPNNTYSNTAPNNQIYDGNNIAVIHDGFKRHMIIKDIATAVTFREPNSSGSPSFIIGGTSTKVFFCNPNTNQLRSISNTGTIINEQIHNLNFFNKYKDLQYTGTNATRNTFRPTCGNIFGEVIVVAGYLENASAGLSIAGQAVTSNSICYMYSENSGSTFEGPFFPFIKSGNNEFQQGLALGIVFVNDNYYFTLIDGTIHKLNVVQSLGVDLIGDDILNDGDLDSPANLNNNQLAISYFDNRLFFQNTNRTGYYEFNLETDSLSFTTLSNITSFSVIDNQLVITTLNECTPVIVIANNNSGLNTITSFILNGEKVELQINIGKVLVEDNPPENFNSPLYNGVINTDHFLQPATIEIIQE